MDNCTTTTSTKSFTLIDRQLRHMWYRRQIIESQMFSKFPALRRVLIYTILSYIGLILVNNSNYELDNMWLIYAPMFVTIYIFSRWLDSKFAAMNTNKQQNNNNQQ